MLTKQIAIIFFLLLASGLGIELKAEMLESTANEERFHEGYIVECRSSISIKDCTYITNTLQQITTVNPDLTGRDIDAIQFVLRSEISEGQEPVQLRFDQSRVIIAYPQGDLPALLQTVLTAIPVREHSSDEVRAFIAQLNAMYQDQHVVPCSGSRNACFEALSEYETERSSGNIITTGQVVVGPASIDNRSSETSLNLGSLLSGVVNPASDAAIANAE